MLERIAAELRESAQLHDRVADNLAQNIARTVETIVSCFRTGGKVLLCGNGGSAADCQHLAAEMVGRFALDRSGLPAIALTTNTSILTSVSNDWDFEQAFSRQVEALICRGDILIALSTSGESKNVTAAVRLAKERGGKTVGLVGGNGGTLSQLVDIPLVVQSEKVPRAQECHIAIGHVICEMVEEELFGK